MADEVLRPLVWTLQEAGAGLEARCSVARGHRRARGTCRLHAVLQGGAGVQHPWIPDHHVPEGGQLLHV